jgi:hypothetical protein
MGYYVLQRDFFADLEAECELPVEVARLEL